MRRNNFLTQLFISSRVEKGALLPPICYESLISSWSYAEEKTAFYSTGIYIEKRKEKKEKKLPR